MKTPENYIFDTSVLIAFSKLRLLDLLCPLYEKILITHAVQEEFSESLPGCSEIIEVKPEIVETFREQMNIGSGEASVILYSLKAKDNTICFIDEQRANGLRLYSDRLPGKFYDPVNLAVKSCREMHYIAVNH